jgi:TetR/AcrR family transcriptional regulator, cholesterol catabolism regulator
MASNSTSAAGRRRRPPRQKPGVKKEQILKVAIDYFGRDGYEETKWADVAAAVDIGSTALYHYFVSKQHCLFEIMAQTIADYRGRFDRIVAENDDWTEALIALLVDSFDIDEEQVLRQRIIVAEFGRVGTPRSLPREEAARASARSQTRDLEYAWGNFLVRGMQQGLIPENDPRLLTRAILGLYNSVWHWYRPGGTLDLRDVGSFFVSKQLAILGCRPDLAEAKFAELRRAA